MKRAIRKSGAPALQFLFSVIPGLLLCGAGLLCVAFYMTKQEAPPLLLPASLLLCVFLGAFASGFLCKRKLRRQGVRPLLIVMGCYLVPVLIPVLIANLKDLSMTILALFPTVAIGAFIGGVLADRLR